MRQGRAGDPITDINVTPLVDVVLVLLVVLMVTTSTIVSSALPLELPAAQTGESARAPMAVGIDREGVFSIEGRAVSDEELRDRARAQHAGWPELPVIISADGGVPHMRVVQALDLLRSERIVRFAFSVAPPAPGT